jgi:hypothetical protein
VFVYQILFENQAKLNNYRDQTADREGRNLRKRKKDTGFVPGSSTPIRRKRQRKRKNSIPTITFEQENVSDVSSHLPFVVGNTYFKIKDINLDELKVINFVN